KTRTFMARVTVEDCLDHVDNRFELVAYLLCTLPVNFKQDIMSLS
ncbi:DNA-directed RNA polymerase subunit omega, partial [Acinetobacter baumannii]